jgi:AbrB family looped-hinge helix DNA binding protein
VSVQAARHSRASRSGACGWYTPGMPRIHDKGQVTLPKAAREEAGLAVGDELTVRTVGPGRLELIRTQELVESLAGSLDQVSYPDGYLRDLRSEWPQ